ncbi:MAG: PepSY-associated TM helix domain-containing protein [Hyphomicrobiaceae bacterium]
MRPWFLRLHRWLALLFGVPLTVVVLTGLVLSVEPWLVSRAIAPGKLDVAKLETFLARHDPEGKARGLSYRSYDGTVTIGGGRGGGTIVDVGSGQTVADASPLAKALVTARRLHETLLLDANWLVVASTAAMLALMLIGVLMGLPRFANSASGWHKAIAWGLLPLLVLSPLTALLMAGGITFAGGAGGVGGRPAPAPISLVEAVRVVGRDHDPGALVWLRQRGPRMMARIVEDGEYRVYAVTREGAVPLPRNWPRAWHEGNFAGSWSAAMNLVISIAFSVLMGTGLWIWLRRKLRRRNRPRRAAAAA